MNNLSADGLDHFEPVSWSTTQSLSSKTIMRHLARGKKPIEAALAGAQEVGFTVFSSQRFADRGIRPACCSWVA
ncbi:hypothetical protein [Paraburkholderia sp. BL6669N2]|uniref:hypothetical protein n=1 Tax=Paraburkholderia sp. BL6669N2 TaxID=1938807 RepID=UPI0011C041B4|nr:hypothetical protein [Paraburkholderia sp. BL6669N2]